MSDYTTKVDYCGFYTGFVLGAPTCEHRSSAVHKPLHFVLGHYTTILPFPARARTIGSLLSSNVRKQKRVQATSSLELCYLVASSDPY